MSIISTRDLNRQIPLPLEEPAGLTIHIFLSPSIPNYGNFFFNSSHSSSTYLNLGLALDIFLSFATYGSSS